VERVRFTFFERLDLLALFFLFFAHPFLDLLLEGVGPGWTMR